MAGEQQESEERLGVSRVAVYLDVSESTVRRMAEDGRLPHYRYVGGRTIRFERADLNGYLARSRVEASPKCPSTLRHVDFTQVQAPTRRKDR